MAVHMGNITQDDMQHMADQLGITAEDVARPVTLSAVRAECNRCGTCCRTQNGIVISLHDVFRIAEKLKLTPKNFIRQYCRDSRTYDVFGHGMYPGISIATKKGACPFFREGAGCSINDIKPLVCRLYPFNTIHVTRASLLKMVRLNDDVRYKGCYIFDLPGNAIVPPDFKALAVYHVHMTVTRDYFARYGSKWHENIARAAMSEGERLAGDEKVISGYMAQMREAFDELDRRNAEMLAGAMAGFL
jgi:Fe-S-cluster containining protein